MLYQYNLLHQYNFLQFSLFILFSLWISYLVITDDRFSFNRKLLFFFIIIILYIISYYLDKLPYLIIKDLFWYSLILNGSFIFHVLVLDRLFYYCWKNHYEYMGFIISRISFFLSLTGLYYLISNSRGYIFFFFSEVRLIEYKKKERNDILTYYASFYLNYVKNYFIKNYIFKLIYKIIFYSILIIERICINFLIIFCNYSLLILGKSKKNYNKEIIFKLFIYFIILLYISYLISVPRIYIIWLIYALIDSYKIFNLEYYPRPNAYWVVHSHNLNIIDKIKYWKIENKAIPCLYDYFDSKYLELEKIYEKPYHKFFMFDLYKYYKLGGDTKFSDIWGTPIWDDKILTLNSLYKFNTWENIAIGYINYTNEYFKKLYEEEDVGEEDRIRENKIFRIAEALMWINLINKDKTFINKLISDIIINDNDIVLAKELLLKKLYDE
jgi:hypothetical protein